LTARPASVDVETRGELTRGMLVVDTRPEHKSEPNVDMAIAIDVEAVREYIDRVLRLADRNS
jgi:purine nucleosidase